MGVNYKKEESKTIKKIKFILNKTNLFDMLFRNSLTTINVDCIKDKNSEHFSKGF